MKNFLAVLNLAACSPRRMTMLVLCSLSIGALWGANIGVLLPFLETVFYGETVSQALERRIVQCEDAAAKFEAEIRSIAESGADNPVDARLRSLRERADQSRLHAGQLRQWAPLADKWLPRTPFGTILAIVGFLAAATMSKCLLMAVNDILVVQLTQNALFQLRSRLFRHTLTLDIESLSEARTSSLMSRFTQDLQRVGEGIRAVLGQSLREPFKMLACLAGAALISWQLLVFSLLVLPAALLVFAAASRRNRKSHANDLASMSDLYARLTESLSGIRAVRSFGCEGHERRKFHRVSREILKRQQRTGTVQSIAKPSFELLGIAIVSAGLLAGGWAVLTQQTRYLGVPFFSRPLSPAALFVFFALLVGATDPLRKLAGISVSANRAAAAADRVFRVLDEVPQIQSPPCGERLQLQAPTIEFRDVGFRYRGQEQPAVQSIDLTVVSGECVALIGANGSGKSTLLDLLLRLYDPRHGEIRVDGYDLRSLNLARFRSMTSLIPQRPFLVDDTVAQNIRCGRSWHSDEEVEAAARQAGAHRFIVEQLADGYQTRIGEAGSSLSGGQAQMLSLARAILRNPGLVLMDEPTSALDSLAEMALVTRLKPFLQGRTCLLISHRAPLLILASRIVLLDQGRVADMGTHAELLVRSELYRSMVDTPAERAA